ncbi:pre-mRNA-splicing factor 38B [Cardiocondyla obscurior]|uniref:pre-mRNA-splicing factor 38B n=1 Tax=Cardiocondyla obscurior TaxID=286306 RepID=UPI003965741F
MPARRAPKIEALVVNAIRRLQDVQGSTMREISSYISQEYNVPSEETKRQVQLALKRGLSYGILKRSKRYRFNADSDRLNDTVNYTCLYLKLAVPISFNLAIKKTRKFGLQMLRNGTGDGVIEPCPSQPWRFGVRARKRKRRRARLNARKRRARLAREQAKRKRRARESARKRRRGRSGRRKRGRSRAKRGGGRTSRRGRRRRRAGREKKRERNDGRVRTRADPREIETEANIYAPEEKRRGQERRVSSQKRNLHA